MEEYTKEYMHFLNHSKTERECADTVVNLVEKEGFTDLAALVRDKKKLKAGDKVYATWMNKAVFCAESARSLWKRVEYRSFHIDSPRLDIKPNPLYENTGVAYLDTHYLWWNQEISVGHITTCDSWCGSQEGWHHRRNLYR